MRYSVGVTEQEVESNPHLREHVYKNEYGFWTIKQKAQAYRGKCRVQVEADDYFGGQDSQPYLSRVLINPTWGTLFRCAKRAQKFTKDYHHDFFENFWVYTVEPCPKTGEDIAIIRLSLGS